MLQRHLLRRGTILIGALAFLIALSPASAGAKISWCSGDPVIKIDGKVADILLSSYTAIHDTATGPAQIVVTIPATSTAELLATDRGFGGHGYVVTFETSRSLKATDGQTPIRIDVFVPSSDTSLPLRVDFLPRSSSLAPASAEGFVGKSWVTLTTG